MLEGMDFTVNATTVVDAAPTDVFDLITDIDQLPAWNAEIVEVVEGGGALEVGSEWVVEMRALHTHWRSRSQALEIDPERGRFAYRSQTDDGNPSYAEWQWDIAPDPAGTRVRVSVDAHPRTFFRKLLVARIRPKGLQQAMDRSLDALGERLAAPPTEATTDKDEE